MEKNVLKEFNKEVQQLNDAFQNIVTNKFVPITHGEKSYTVENIKEVQDNLKKQEFTISVCGQINAGKSSFLNYLLFNDKDVLPADDTPWTAKLTTIRYGEENYATAIYYNKEEWASLKKQTIKNEDGEETTYYDEFLKKDVNEAALEGFQVETYITANTKTEDGIALTDLVEYVTKKGHLTPFVKQVDIKVKNELVKGVVFVDTPGLNDRNELRSKVTEDWIKKSCAVIYLFYAGQALSSADYQFIDEHLSSVPTEKIIFALTKADISADYEGAKSFVEKTLKEDVELKKRKFITENKSVYPISTLSALINYKQLNNIQLSEDDEFHLERIMDECPSFIQKNGFIDEFVAGLKSHLMTQTGKAIITKTSAVLQDIYKTNEDSLLSDINTTKDKLQSINLSNKELEDKVAELNGLIDEIQKFKKDFERKTIDKQVAQIKSSLKLKLNKFKEIGMSSLNSSLEDASSDSIKSLRSVATHLTKNALVEISDKIHNSLLNELSIETEINDLLETFSNNFQEIITGIEVYEGSLSCHVQNQSALVENISYNQLSVDGLKDTCGRNYGSLFNKDSVKTRIFTQIRIVFDNHTDSIIQNVVANIDNIIKKNINDVYNNVNTEVKKLKENANDLLSSTENTEEQKKTFQAKIVSSQERLDTVMLNFKTLEKCV
ncbi:dynamin family protein [Tenacibaculum finnmarkense]|uniref:dynamin family protein n=1 Tax=Tenacibaculum finnmarkense TaxID=2781243 RepID=UPI001EFB5EA3|nr:dynamin family protein [Tenacibaculum finnmarkense]MCG8748645.1 hypothetical protein [Tenacibaculum finnmarkense]MCG8753457.1 hypothetical protein [Tenacibaculum finnmarkense]MCG8782300.1 hypothetical protein [Tenacibaculum finnmarkense]